MRLISLSIQGFKSFANTTELTFGPGVTGVIGPNGSGKSNVAEAIRWVLGEQSMKALRGKERADVLYSGTAKHASYARVTLTFDNQSGRFPIHAGEISVSRTLTADGESEYAINKEPVRLIDLQQMLAEAGIGAKSYTVISQGMIDQYLTANPEGRRELFNEATGIKSLQIKIAQSQQKLKKSQAHAQEVSTILEELAPRLTLLQRQMDRYDERDTYLQKFKTMQKSYYHHAWQAGAQELSGHNAEHSKIEQDIAKAREVRIQAEQYALENAGRAHPKEALMHELASERATYALAFQQWKRNEEEKAELTTSLARIAAQKKQLEPALSASSTSIPAQDIRTTLLACKDFLDQIMHDIIPPKPVAKRLLHSITASLQTTPKHAPQDSPEILFAKLSAVEEEQARRLQKLPIIEKPSDTTIKNIEEKIRTLPKESQQAHSHTDPEHARQAELLAERAGASSHARIDEKTRALKELEHEISRECGSETLEFIQHTPYTGQEHPTENQLRSLSSKIATIGERDELVAKEYEETKQRHDALRTQLEDVQQTMQRIQEGIDDVLATMQKTFDQKFSEITAKFSEYFTHLFGGGSATLESNAQGVEISVIPPGKRARHITLLSGGERALTSIALLFAILDAQMPPFIVLDEVDAALDEANSHRFARLLREHSHTTQSIVISHNRETMSQSDLLYGVTMHKNGVSTVYSVKIMDYVEDPA